MFVVNSHLNSGALVPTDPEVLQFFIDILDLQKVVLSQLRIIGFNQHIGDDVIRD